MLEKQYKKQIDFVISRIREEREKARLSQIDLAFAAGLSQNQVNCIETGRSIPNLYSLVKIAVALEIPIESLFVTPSTERKKDAEKIIRLIKKYMN
ncbi:MAG: helix-turn-helix transcriptional regulator [Treponema sp.]|nr:helix-turn-helix transcriptional regulator [Treponema sp.]